HLRSKCTPRGSALMSTMPSAKKAVKTMPIDESSFVLLNRLTTLMNTADRSPAAKAASRSWEISTLPVSMKATTTPGSTAWDSASPISAMRRSTTKQPSTPHATPTSTLQAVSCHHRSVNGVSHRDQSTSATIGNIGFLALLGAQQRGVSPVQQRQPAAIRPSQVLVGRRLGRRPERDHLLVEQHDLIEAVEHGQVVVHNENRTPAGGELV